jgi:dihydrodipicolinate synthase/N-acetylneuraminate lyase
MPHSALTSLHGTLVALLTPFDRAGNVLYDAYPDLLAFQKTGGTQGIVVCGTNAEATSLSVAERKRVLETVMANRGDFPIIAGTGATSITDALELTQHAKEVGADAALALPPFFVKNPTPEGVANYFRILMDAVEIPLLLYSIPHFTAVPIAEPILSLLEGHPQLAGLKDSSGDWDNTLRLLRGYPNLSIFPGSDLVAGNGYLHGAQGTISGTANSFPEIVAAVPQAKEQGTQAVLKAQERLTALLGILRQYPVIAVNKSVLTQRGFPRFSVRPSLVDLTPEQEANLFRQLHEGGFAL